MIEDEGRVRLHKSRQRAMGILCNPLSHSRLRRESRETSDVRTIWKRSRMKSIYTKIRSSEVVFKVESSLTKGVFSVTIELKPIRSTVPTVKGRSFSLWSPSRHQSAHPLKMPCRHAILRHGHSTPPAVLESSR